MNWKRIPVVPTLVVLAAVAVMVRLGFWQIDRMHQKEALLARFAANQAMSSNAAFPAGPDGTDQVLYRHTSGNCVAVKEITARAGTSASGRSGWAHHARCVLRSGEAADVVLGWSQSPASPQWQGGAVQGLIAPGPRLIADPPLAGLQPNARPDPRDLPNNHFAYAVQWFLFALTALVIYAIALRKRLRPS